MANLVEQEAAIGERKVDWPTILNSLKIISANLISISNSLRDKSDKRDDHKRELLFGLKTSILFPKHYSEDVYADLKVGKFTMWSHMLISIGDKHINHLIICI